jgi:hypothetical protein
MRGMIPIRVNVEEAVKQSAIMQTALLTVLIEKGVCTPEEFRAAMLAATSFVDQEWQVDKDEAREELKKQSRGMEIIVNAFEAAAARQISPD